MWRLNHLSANFVTYFRASKKKINAGVTRHLLLILLLLLTVQPLATEKKTFRQDDVPVDARLNVAWSPVDPVTAGYFDDYFTQRQRSAGFNGAVLIARGGKVFSNAYGYREIRSRDKEPLTTNTPFQLASVSKPITAVAVLQLVEQGYCRLDDEVACLLPDFPYQGITVHMLLSHTSGLPNYLYMTDERWPDGEQPMTQKDAYCIMLDAEVPAYYRPGRRFDYSNTNYFLLALLVEELTGQTFPDYVEANIFRPAGMAHSFVLDCYGYQTIPGVAIGSDAYRRNLGEYYLNSVYGDKSLFSTVEDLYRFDQALRKGYLLNTDMQSLAYQPHSRWNNLGRSYGYGWRIIREDQSSMVVFHTGWWQGFKTYFIRDLKQDLTIIVLSNSLRGSTLGILELLNLMNQAAPAV